MWMIYEIKENRGFSSGGQEVGFRMAKWFDCDSYPEWLAILCQFSQEFSCSMSGIIKRPIFGEIALERRAPDEYFSFHSVAKIGEVFDVFDGGLADLLIRACKVKAFAVIEVLGLG